ncbi:MAG: carboxypeptidase-like regulatory domain-containing protein [Candidatus Dormibacteraeota bacterium]|nr:carboxypeptidase-like regulatory domain-containing protein [Candidatus Dormibacteraeota bacterium]
MGKAAIKGQVTDTVTHLGIAAATVTLSPSGASQLTDTNGNFAFTVDAGTYTVTVNAPAYNNASQTVTVSPGQRLSLSFSLAYSSARGSITGSVKDSQTGAAIAGALVQATGGFTTVTDLSGSFTFPAVYPGANTVTVSQPGYVTQSQSIKVRQWQSVAVAFSLVKG